MENRQTETPNTKRTSSPFEDQDLKIFGATLDESRAKRSATERWGGKTVLFSEGFLSVPNRFLRQYALLKPPLSPGEALFVLQLMTFKWERAAPFPSYKSVAKAMGVTDKMARRYAQGLQKKGYLMRQFQNQAPNKFDLTGLFEALAQIPRERQFRKASEGDHL